MCEKGPSPSRRHGVVEGRPHSGAAAPPSAPGGEVPLSSRPPARPPGFSSGKSRISRALFYSDADIWRAFGLGLGASARNDDAKNASGMGRIAAAICHSINNLTKDFLVINAERRGRLVRALAMWLLEFTRMHAHA